jgi:hypothetical protein
MPDYLKNNADFRYIWETKFDQVMTYLETNINADELAEEINLIRNISEDQMDLLKGKEQVGLNKLPQVREDLPHDSYNFRDAQSSNSDRFGKLQEVNSYDDYVRGEVQNCDDYFVGPGFGSQNPAVEASGSLHDLGVPLQPPSEPIHNCILNGDLPNLLTGNDLLNSRSSYEMTNEEIDLCLNSADDQQDFNSDEETVIQFRRDNKSISNGSDELMTGEETCENEIRLNEAQLMNDTYNDRDSLTDFGNDVATKFCDLQAAETVFESEGACVLSENEDSECYGIFFNRDFPSSYQLNDEIIQNLNQFFVELILKYFYAIIDEDLIKPSEYIAGKIINEQKLDVIINQIENEYFNIPLLNYDRILAKDNPIFLVDVLSNEEYQRFCKWVRFHEWVLGNEKELPHSYSILLTIFIRKAANACNLDYEYIDFFNYKPRLSEILEEIDVAGESESESVFTDALSEPCMETVTLKEKKCTGPPNIHPEMLRGINNWSVSDAESSSRDGSVSEASEALASAEDSDSNSVTIKRKRGRPPGSKKRKQTDSQSGHSMLTRLAQFNRRKNSL